MRDFGEIIRRIDALPDAASRVLGEAAGYPIYSVTFSQDVSRPVFFINGGTHGDEPAGVGGALAFMLAVNGRSSVLTAFSPIKWGSWPIISVACAIISGVANTGGSLLVQRAQARGMDPGTATSIAALYPALMTCLSVSAGFEKLSVLKVCGLLLAAGSGVCFAKDIVR